MSLFFCVSILLKNLPVDIYLFKVKNENTRKMYEICLKFTIKDTKKTSPLLLTLNRFTNCSGFSNVDFEQANSSWDPVELSKKPEMS